MYSRVPLLRTQSSFFINVSVPYSSVFTPSSAEHQTLGTEILISLERFTHYQDVENHRIEPEVRSNSEVHK